MDQSTNPIPIQDINQPNKKLNRFVIGTLLFVICIVAIGYTYLSTINFLKPDAVSIVLPQKDPLSEEEKVNVLAGLEDLKNRVSNERALKILDELDASSSNSSSIPESRKKQVIESL